MSLCRENEKNLNNRIVPLQLDESWKENIKPKQ